MCFLVGVAHVSLRVASFRHAARGFDRDALDHGADAALFDHVAHAREHYNLWARRYAGHRAVLQPKVLPARRNESTLSAVQRARGGPRAARAREVAVAL